MDYELRCAEREFLMEGDPEAEERFIRYCARIGLRFRNHKREEILSEWEEIQQDYDDIAWQGKPWRGLLSQWCGIGCCGYMAATAKKLVKARDLNFRSNWGDNNAKRKTLRTHRDGSRRGFRLRN